MSASRISPPAAPGSLLKGFKSEEKSPPRSATLSSRPPGKQKKASRERNEAHLKLIRACPCIVCGGEPSEAAHIRQSAPGKPLVGMGLKPDDKFTVPLCHDHHMVQHRIGEKSFFDQLGIDPLLLAAKLFSKSPDLAAMRAIVLTTCSEG